MWVDAEVRVTGDAAVATDLKRVSGASTSLEPLLAASVALRRSYSIVSLGTDHTVS